MQERYTQFPISCFKDYLKGKGNKGLMLYVPSMPFNSNVKYVLFSRRSKTVP